MKELRFKKMGMDIYENIESDLESYRIRLVDSIETKDGKTLVGDVMRGNVSEYKNGKIKKVRDNALAADLQFTDENGNTWAYRLYELNGEYDHNEYKESYYTKEYLLNKINSISKIQYDLITIID